MCNRYVDCLVAHRYRYHTIQEKEGITNHCISVVIVTFSFDLCLTQLDFHTMLKY